MALLDDILSAGNGGAVGQIAAKLGIPDDLARQAASALTPALSRGIERNTQQPGGLDSLLGALSSGDHQKYVDQPDTIGQEASIEDGNKILGHVLGSKDVSRNVAGAASAKTGIDAGTLKKMLPMLATVAMGALSKKTAAPGGPSSGLTGGAGSNPLNALQSMGGLGALTQFLDADKDGNATDELLDMAKKYF
jgi:hypothetical protein